ncbi:MAG TPA: hypothetical protein VMW56_09170 [Candidatus Margulisiibacteriota bacterium]|nr:hypothetical protein [Candidatus Margulisiibacteriota bacterium]
MAGSAIGALTTLGASWLTQREQLRTQQLTHDIGRREDLYKDFIEEASKVYGDAIEHGPAEGAEASKLVRLYALISRMRVLSSPVIAEHADDVVRIIIDTYLGPKMSLREVSEKLKSSAFVDPLRDFGEACREELRQIVFPRWGVASFRATRVKKASNREAIP